MVDLSKLKPKIEDVCKMLRVKRLGVFGSAMTTEFRPCIDTLRRLAKFSENLVSEFRGHRTQFAMGRT